MKCWLKKTIVPREWILIFLWLIKKEMPVLYNAFLLKCMWNIEMNWTKTMLSSRLQTGQEKVLEGVEMASPSYFTLSLHFTVLSLFGPCPAPPSLFIFLLTLLLLIIPLSPRASADGWAHLLQISIESNQDTVVASLLHQWAPRIEISAYKYCMCA